MEKESGFNILFIYPNVNTHYSFSPAIEILSSYLKMFGYQTDLIHINDKFSIPLDKNTIQTLVIDKNPDLICFTSTTYDYNEANKIAGWINELDLNRLIILGGIHSTIKPNDVDSSNFDAFCIGEGEKPLLNLIKKLINGDNIFKTKSFWFKGKERNEIEPYLKDLSELPYHDFDIIDTKKLLKERNGWLSLSFSRGCPYKCSFCINPLLRKINNADKTYLRKRTVKDSIEELEYLSIKYKGLIKVFNLDDDLLMIFKDWILDFCKQYKKKIYEKYDIKFSTNCRVDLLDDDIAKKLSESGCFELKIGVETANNKLRNGLLHKNISKKQIAKAFSICRKNNIQSIGYFMLGLPGENEDTILETIDLVNMVKPDLMRTTFLHPYFGSEIYEYCDERKLFKDKEYIDTFTESPLIIKGISEKDLLKYKFMFPWYVNSKIIGLGDTYNEAISKFDHMDYEELLNNHDSILDIDSTLSENLNNLGISHFKYFNKNKYYYQYKRL